MMPKRPKILKNMREESISNQTQQQVENSLNF